MLSTSVTKTDKERYVKAIREYLLFVKQVSTGQATNDAEIGFENIVMGMDLVGNKFPKHNMHTLAERLTFLTEGFFQPIPTDERKYKFNVDSSRASRRKSTKSKPDISITDGSINTIKRALISEYPNLNRRDLLPILDNYATLTAKIKAALAIDGQSATVKNLVDAQIKVAALLGINESEKAKQKLLDDKKSIASLSMKFQETIDEMPELLDKFRYEEIKILLEKLDRQELSQELFESRSYSNMTVEEARTFVFAKDKEFSG